MIYPVCYRGSDRYGTIIAIVGMQFGSEGKGAIASHLAPIVTMGVRSGAANAGHTIYYHGRKFIMRQIPSAWIKPEAILVIGAGSIISLEILLREIEHVNRFLRIKERLHIDYRAHIITPEQIRQEQDTDLALRIGSTSALSGEGIGIAAADKVLRKSSCLQAKDYPELKPYLSDTVDLINTHLENGRGSRVLLEGTQGFGLSLDYGYFPFVTSRDTSVEGLFASVGVAMHKFPTEVIGVTRTYPIRVAGNSGPFGDDSEEITWGEITKRSGTSQEIIEKTSVTGKVRRVGTFSKKEFLRSCQVNRPTYIALTFADYLDWSIHNQDRISEPVEEFMLMIKKLSGVPVPFIKTGPGPHAIVDFEKIMVKSFYKSLTETDEEYSMRKSKMAREILGWANYNV